MQAAADEVREVVDRPGDVGEQRVLDEVGSVPEGERRHGRGRRPDTLEGPAGGCGLQHGGEAEHGVDPQQLVGEGHRTS